MIWCALILCVILLIKGELTQNEKEKTLCFHDTLLQMTSNCRSVAKRKVNTLKWNKTLEYFAHVHARNTYFEDLTIPKIWDFRSKANIVSMDYEVDQYEGLYEMLPNVTKYYDKKGGGLLATFFYRLTSTNKTTQMGCDYTYTNRTVVPAIHILCFFNFPLSVQLSKDMPSLFRILGFTFLAMGHLPRQISNSEFSLIDRLTYLEMDSKDLCTCVFLRTLRPKCVMHRCIHIRCMEETLSPSKFL
ncbi:hypothetical protein EG68_10002 [Paragonimus skrjabini miyazakii]|uniref:Uncharacterized protein n=1 Tax=Paragonimus skrjabini miyazakii TaxID=59628 RepID=A0A8S9Z2G2_9TREM|nr:hypothetical protein EG68_10002 [Paragonimus skrjabini miyazakii]